ncbi:phosphoenolpyruvate--protein phosphotransferase [Bremerella sp. T1]|uniref:phosphoenolpyruvate--protein phosphotransferase n=1 Tax=Bremerella sp. TYQ1 TaxID=3119568 RepID=UPI001CCB72EB|nr:phosphoenolpyruvate--protein phosphotransferase [Bremerella volcania]UBM36984.1 phosphoenolpyruvate--protein phosphotransferase [Bremerella volcania]
MITLQGIPLSPGMADGLAIIYDYEVERRLELPNRPISDTDVENQETRLDDALAQSTQELKSAETFALNEPRLMGSAELLSVHASIAQEIAALVRKRITTDRINAEEALDGVVQEFVGRFEKLENNYIREREQDVRDVGRRILKHLITPSPCSREPLPPGSVVITRELMPSEAVELVKSGVVAILTERGGTLSHTAIVARSLGIPAISGIPELVSRVQPGTRILVDGESGRAEITPTKEAESLYFAHARERESHRRKIAREEELPCVTNDGVFIRLFGNMGLPMEAKDVVEHNLSGVGLFRTEFLFLESRNRPSLEEQVEIYSSMSSGLGNLPLTIRTFDLGGDKLPPFLLSEKSHANASLDLRGLRFSLQEVELLDTQLRAILHVARTANVRILFPMVIGPEDFSLAIRAVERATGYVGIQQRPRIGAMIETPAALFALDEILELADFVAIGTNDLTQYMLAVDRSLIDSNDDCSAMHPAVIRAIKLIIDASEEHKCPICVCGEEAGDVDFARLLVGLGVRELSVTPNRAAAVRHAIRQVCLGDLQVIAGLALKCRTPQEVRELFHQGAEAQTLSFQAKNITR